MANFIDLTPLNIIVCVYIYSEYYENMTLIFIMLFHKIRYEYV